MITTTKTSTAIVFILSAMIFGATNLCRADDMSAPAVAASTSTAPGTYLLRYKFAPGQSVTYKMSTDTASAMPAISGQSMPAMNMHMEMTRTLTVQSVNTDGSAVVKTTFDSITMSMNGQSMPSGSMDKLAALSPTYTMTPTGKILSLSMGSGGTMSAIPDAGMGGTGMAGSMALLPEQAIKPGDSWRGTYTVAGMDIYTKNTLTAVQQVGGANIASIVTKIFMQMKNSAPASSSMKFSMNMLANSTGTTQFDMDAGQVKSTTSSMVMDTTITPGADSSMPMGPTKTKMTIKSQMDQM